MGYFFKLIQFSFRNQPALYFALGLIVLSSSVELLVLNSFLPLSASASNQPITEDNFFVMFFAWAQIKPDTKLFFLTFIVLFGLRIITMIISEALNIYLGKMVHAKLSTDAFRKIFFNLDIAEIERKSIGYYISLAGDEAARSGHILLLSMRTVNFIFLTILYYGAIFMYSLTAWLSISVFLLICAVFSIKYSLMMKRLGGISLNQSRQTGSLLIDALNGLRYVKAFSAEQFVTSRYTKTFYQYSRTNFKIEYLHDLSKLLPLFMILLFFGGFIYFSESTSADFPFHITLLLIMLRFFMSLGDCTNSLSRITSHIKTGKNVIAAIQPDKKSMSGEKIAHKVDRIQIERLSFQHDIPVISGLNLTLEKGRSYAIHGPSGAGKSTLANLLVGFYIPSGGNILINSQDITAIDSAALREKLLLIGQETIIFNDTVANNIKFGKKFTRPQIEAACRLAMIDDYISSLPAGYETLLHYQGRNLSGGQKQRIGIARALVRNPDVFIFDESTSALDTATKTSVVGNILDTLDDQIAIFITHDDAVHSLVDEIIDFTRVNKNIDR